MDWEVAARPLWRRLDSGEFEQHPKWREVYRTDNEGTLGVCRGRYEIFNNREAFAFGDELVSEGTGKWVTAGQQVGGARVFMVMKLGEGFDVLGGDSYQSYLYLRTSHGDGTSISASVIPFRLWCTNQNGAAIREAKSSWSIPHTTTVTARVEEAREALKLTMNYEAEFKKLADQLAAVKISDDKAKQLIASVFPENRARRDDIIADVISNYQSSPTVEPFRGTGYGLYNGLTEYMDHVKVQRNSNARFNSIMYGEGKKVQDQLLDNLRALV
jgi:phage/plasmid-like protein (TIGR03299 family)